MPQALLPLVPDGATGINEFFSVVREGGQWTYFLGVRPVFQHAEEDPRSFRMFTAQLICQGGCLQSEVVRTFGVSAIGEPWTSSDVRCKAGFTSGKPATAR